MILQIRLNLDIFTVWKKLKNSVVKCEKTFSLTELYISLYNTTGRKNNEKSIYV